MAPAAYVAGFNAKVRINGAVFVAQSYRCRDLVDDLDVSNTEGVPGNPNGGVQGPSTESRFSGLQHMEAQVRNATYDANANFFAVYSSNQPTVGATVKSGMYIALKIYPGSVNGAPTGNSWNAPSFLVTETDMEMNIHGLQPVSFSGKSDGFYNPPSS